MLGVDGSPKEEMLKSALIMSGGLAVSTHFYKQGNQLVLKAESFLLNCVCKRLVATELQVLQDYKTKQQFWNVLEFTVDLYIFKNVFN